jgi:hypothetical protein
MTTLEFWTRVNPDDTLTVPPDVAAQVRRERPVRVILLVPESEEDEQWARSTADQFLKGYAEGDSIYDELPAG